MYIRIAPSDHRKAKRDPTRDLIESHMDGGQDLGASRSYFEKAFVLYERRRTLMHDVTMIRLPSRRAKMWSRSSYDILLSYVRPRPLFTALPMRMRYVQHEMSRAYDSTPERGRGYEIYQRAAGWLRYKLDRGNRVANFQRWT